MTQHDLNGRLAVAAAGDRIVYHTGSLMYDRKIGANFLSVTATAVAAFAAMERGEVRLLQKKIAPGQFAYIAEKLPAPYKPVEWEGCYVVDKYLNPARRRGSRRDPSAMASFVASTQAARKVGASTGAHA